MNLLFWFRLIFYYCLLVLPLVHPALAVYPDFAVVWGLFVLIPGQAVLGFYQPKINGKLRWLLPLGLMLLSIPLMGLTGTMLPLWIGAAWFFLSTYLGFHRSLPQLLYLEPFYLAIILFRLLSFSQSSQEMMAITRGLNLGLILIAGLGFSLYLVLIYRVAQQGRGKTPLWREALLLVLAGMLLALLAGGLVNFQDRDNLRDTPPVQEREPRNQNRHQNDGLDGDNGSAGDATEASNGEPAELIEVSEDEWAQQGAGSSGEPPQQYMVMVVRSSEPLVYMARRYLVDHDGVEGFLFDPELDLNRLTTQRYLETWENPDFPNDLRRIATELHVYSTESQPGIPYFPYQLEPTVRDTRYQPLSYSYRSLSLTSQLTQGVRASFVPPFSSEEERELARYLELDMSEELKVQYLLFLMEKVDLNAPWDLQIDQIRRSFDEHQYMVGFSDNTTVDSLAAFMFDNMEGDCTEFSHSAVILGRLAGIPSRVVTGYILSEDLQTPAHKEGLARLQEVFDPLAEEPLEELYLITTAHRHSWAQFYIPNHGWVDFETTSFAIPPPMGFDMTQANVVIPQLRPMEQARFLRNLPWKQMGLILASLVGLLILFRYSVRRIALLRLAALSRRPDPRGFKALYSLLINRYNGLEKQPKDPSWTPRELAEHWPEAGDFASLYRDSLYDPSLSADELKTNLEELRAIYIQLLRNHGTLGMKLRAFLSLREVR